MLPSANASGEEQKPRGSWQGEAVEQHHKSPAPLCHICNIPAPDLGTGRKGRGRGTLMLPPHACPSDLEGLSLACSFETGCSHQETREA